MSIDPDVLKRHIRDALDERDREKAREEKDKARDLELAELREKVGKLSAKPDHDAEPKDGDDHEFVA